MRSVFRNIAINAGTLASGSVFNSAIGLLSFSVLAKYLGTELFGILALVQVYGAIIDGLINFQSWQALIKYGTPFHLAGKRDELGRLYSFGFAIDAVTAFVAMLVGLVLPSLGLGYLLGWEDVKVVMASLFATTILFNIEGTPTAIFRMYDKYRVFVLKGLVMSLARLALIVAGVYLEKGIWYFFWSIVVSQLAGYTFFLIASLSFLRREGVHLQLPKFNFAEIKQEYPGILSFVGTTNLHGSIRMVTLRLDTLIVDSFLGSSSTGLYQVAKQFSRVFTQISQPLYKVVYPELTKLWSLGAYREFGLVIRRFCGLAAAFGIMTWCFFYLFPEFVIINTVGEDYLESIPVLLAYLFGVLLSVSVFPVTPAVLAAGYPKVAFKVQLYSTIVYVLALVFLLGEIGLLGAGIAYSVLYVSWIVIMYCYYRFSLRYELKQND